MNIKEIIKEVLVGNKNAYREIVDKTQDMLLTYTAYRLGSLSNFTDEVVQNTYIKAYENLSEFDLDKDFGIWLRTLCFYQILAWKKTRKREQNRYITNIDMLDSFQQELDDDDELFDLNIQSALNSCLDKLPEHSIELISRRYEESNSIADIAESLNRTKNWTATTLCRLRGKLKKCIESHSKEVIV